MATIKIPTPLRPYTAQKDTVTVSGATVGEALSDLITQHPELKPHIYNGDQLRNFVNIFLGDEDIRFMSGMDTEIEPDTALRIIPSIAGGR